MTILYPNGWWVDTSPTGVYVSSQDYGLVLDWEYTETDASYWFTERNQRSAVVQQAIADFENGFIATIEAEGSEVELRRFEQRQLGGLPVDGASIHEFTEDGNWADADIVYGGMASVLCNPHYICHIFFSKIDESFTAADWELLDYFVANMDFRPDERAATARNKMMPSAPSSPTKTAAQLATAEGVDWTQAQDLIGQELTVCGQVAGTIYAERSSGGPTFLNMGNDYPNPERVQIVIWERHRRSFPAPPHVLYDGKSICVDGMIELYNGVPEIEVSRPLQIRIQ